MISKLSNAFSVSGNESEVRNLVLSSIKNGLFEVTCDKIGNVFAKYKNTDGNPSVLLVSHMDECGLIITDICDDGYLKFDIIGEIDASSLVSKRVKSQNANGVISLKAIHLISRDEREKCASVSDLYIDIGAKTKEEALKYVMTGDYFTFSNTCKTIGKDTIIGKGLSRSAGCSILIDFINDFSGGNLNIICVFTTLKEVGGRGIKTALNSISNIKFACILDCVNTLNCDISLRKGPIVGITNNSSSKSDRIAREVCNLFNNIQYEYIKENTNICAISQNIPTVFLGIPCENKTTNMNILSLRDVKNAKELLKTLVWEVK